MNADVYDESEFFSDLSLHGQNIGSSNVMSSWPYLRPLGKASRKSQRVLRQYRPVKCREYLQAQPKERMGGEMLKSEASKGYKVGEVCLFKSIIAFQSERNFQQNQTATHHLL